MDFSLNEEQGLLHASVRRYVDQEGRCSTRHWAQFAQMGWLGAALPEGLGGFGGGAIETAIIAEQLGRGLSLEPFVPVAVLAAQALLAAADAEPARAALGALVDGARVVPAVGPGVAVGAGATTLGGRQTLVVGGPGAERYLVAATEGGGVSLFLLAADAPGLSCHDYRLIDGTPANDLLFDAVPVAAGQRIGSAAGTGGALDQAALHAQAASCAQALGVMDRAIEATREHLLQRRQFGVAIASFQALRHRLADMRIAQEQARATLHGALAALAALTGGAGPASAARAVSIAKAQSGRSGRFIGAQAIQLHGGMGISDECIAGHCFKQLLVLDTLHGPAAAQLRRLAGDLA